MEKYRLPYRRAYVYVKERRTFINPNPAFKQQLKEYERSKYYVSSLKRFKAYMKVNGGENKFKLVSCVVVIIGVIVPLAVLLT